MALVKGSFHELRVAPLRQHGGVGGYVDSYIVRRELPQLRIRPWQLQRRIEKAKQTRNGINLLSRLILLCGECVTIEFAEWNGS